MSPTSIREGLMGAHRLLLGALGGPLARATAASSLINLSRIGLQAVALVLLARKLGAHEFGPYVGITAITAILATLAGLGAGQELVRAVSRDPGHLAEHRSHALRMLLGSGSVLLPVAVAISHYGLAELPLPAIAALCTAELLLMPITQLGSLALLARERFVASQLLLAGTALIRLVSIAAFTWMAASPTLAQYSLWHITASVFAAGVGLSALYAPSDHARGSRPATRSIGRSTVTAASALSGTALSELDKVLASQLTSAVTAGLYGAAYRLVAAVTAPVVSLAQTMQPRFYRLVDADRVASRLFALKLAATAAAFGLAAAVGICIAAPYVTFLLGPTYAPLRELGSEFGALAALLSLRAMSGPVLVCQGRMRTKLAIEVGAIALLVGIALLIMRDDVVSIVRCIVLVEFIGAIAMWTAALAPHSTLSRTAT